MLATLRRCTTAPTTRKGTMACLEHVKREWAKTQTGGHDSVVLGNLEILDARPGFVRTRLKVGKHNLNYHGTMHGGCLMTLVDTVTWLSLTTLRDPIIQSVSTNMSHEFLRPSGREGDYLYAEGECVQAGRRLAYTRVTLKNAQDKVTGFGAHTLALMPAEEGAYWAETQTGCHDTVVLSGLEIVEARPGFVRTRLKVENHHLNNHGTMHGGCVMTLVDSVTWLATVTLGDPVADSVSTNMSAEFLRPCGTLGEYVYAEGEAVQQGRRLAFTRVTFKVNDRITGFGSHTLAVTPSGAAVTKFSADGLTRLPVGAKL
ncbi:Putative esterase [Vanrija pseudolonga]|uniref:Esterase n=1 Tax=Vanrija pseudolonga TaxID=143232 RepID=A0AAF0YIH1_9TREE|nr:Putative esterase [Vanrija pseudolonga]